MADDKQDRKQAVAPKGGKPGLAGFMAGLQQGLGAGDIGMADVSSAAIREALQRVQARSSTTTEILEQARDLEPAGIGGKTQDEAPTKRIRSTRTKHRPGILRVKEYPITEDTMDNIGTLRVSAAFWFAIGSLALGFGLSAWMSLALATGVKEATEATWKAYRNISLIVAVVAFVAGLFYFLKGKSVIQFVKDNTTHDPLD